MRNATDNAIGAEENGLANGRDHEATEFRAQLNHAALKLLRADPNLINRGPELERKLRGLVNKGKLKAPTSVAGRALDAEIAEAVDSAREEFRRNPRRGVEAEQAEPDESDGELAGVERQAGARDRAVPFPEECIRGTAKQYIEALYERGEWPIPFLFAEWRMIHSMAIARSAWYGSGNPRHPHCHDLLIGESGITHKNTSINRAVAIIRLMRPEVCVYENISSIEGLLEDLDDKRRSIALIAAAEYSYIAATSKRQNTSNITPMLNHAFDGADPLTITRKKAPVIQNPFVNLIAGCTPAWIAQFLDKEGADLGRFNRNTIFYADQERDIPNPQYPSPEELKQFADLFNQNLAKAISPPGEITFDPDASACFDEWFKRNRKRLRSLPDNLRKLIERDGDQVRIQAIIYAAAEGRRVVNLGDLEAAVKLVEWSGANKLRLFGEVEFNTDQRLERRILAFISRGGGTMTELYRDLGNLGNREAVHRKLKVLVAEGSCVLSRPLDQPSREPLRIHRP